MRALLRRACDRSVLMDPNSRSQEISRRGHTQAISNRAIRRSSRSTTRSSAGERTRPEDRRRAGRLRAAARRHSRWAGTAPSRLGSSQSTMMADTTAAPNARPPASAYRRSTRRRPAAPRTRATSAAARPTLSPSADQPTPHAHGKSAAAYPVSTAATSHGYARVPVERRSVRAPAVRGASRRTPARQSPRTTLRRRPSQGSPTLGVTARRLPPERRTRLQLRRRVPRARVHPRCPQRRSQSDLGQGQRRRNGPLRRRLHAGSPPPCTAQSVTARSRLTCVTTRTHFSSAGRLVAAISGTAGRCELGLGVLTARHAERRVDARERLLDLALRFGPLVHDASSS